MQPLCVHLVTWRVPTHGGWRNWPHPFLEMEMSLAAAIIIVFTSHSRWCIDEYIHGVIYGIINTNKKPVFFRIPLHVEKMSPLCGAGTSPAQSRSVKLVCLTYYSERCLFRKVLHGIIIIKGDGPNRNSLFGRKCFMDIALRLSGFGHCRLYMWWTRYLPTIRAPPPPANTPSYN